jgi:hypothetical protein
MYKQHGKAAGTCDPLLKTLSFLPSKWIWALGPSFQCSAAKGGIVLIRGFLSRSALSLFSHSRILLLLRPGEHESAKNAGRSPLLQTEKETNKRDDFFMQII